jgi:hypothetical protein
MQLGGGHVRQKFQKVWKIAGADPQLTHPRHDRLLGRRAIYIEGEDTAHL